MTSTAVEIREREGSRPLTVIAVLTGSIIFLADLIRKLDMPLRVANTSSSSEAETATITGTGSSAELVGGEMVGTVGVGFRLQPSALLSIGVSYDNNNAFLFRPGVMVNYKLF